MNKLSKTGLRGANKQEPAFTIEDALGLAEQMKALAHPVRLQILQSLGDRDNCCCNDFCASIPLAQSTISQHLKILNRAGIIGYQPVGNCSHYSLNTAALTQTIDALTKFSKVAGTTGTVDLVKTSKRQLENQKKPNRKVDNQ